MSFADVAATYSDALPQLVDAFNNLRTTNATIVQRRPQIDTLLATLNPTAATTADFLIANRDKIINVAADSRPALEQLATYSPTYTCALANFAKMKPHIDQLMGMGTARPGSRVHHRADQHPRQVSAQPGRAALAGHPRTLVRAGVPGLLRSRPVHRAEPATTVPMRAERNPGDQDSGSCRRRSSACTPRRMCRAGRFAPAEQQTLGAIYGAANGVSPNQVPSWVTRIGAPAFRGSEVSVR